MRRCEVFWVCKGRCTSSICPVGEVPFANILLAKSLSVYNMYMHRHEQKSQNTDSGDDLPPTNSSYEYKRTFVLRVWKKESVIRISSLGVPLAIGTGRTSQVYFALVGMETNSPEANLHSGIYSSFRYKLCWMFVGLDYMMRCQLKYCISFLKKIKALFEHICFFWWKSYPLALIKQYMAVPRSWFSFCFLQLKNQCLVSPDETVFLYI